MGRSLGMGWDVGHRQAGPQLGPQAGELSGPGVSQLLLSLMCSVATFPSLVSGCSLHTPRLPPSNPLLQPHSPRQWRPQPWVHTSEAEARRPQLRASRRRHLLGPASVMCPHLVP